MFGSVPLRTYLPDGDIDISVFSSPAARAEPGAHSLRESWASQLVKALEGEQARPDAPFRIRDLQVIQAEVRGARGTGGLAGRSGSGGGAEGSAACEGCVHLGPWLHAAGVQQAGIPHAHHPQQTNPSAARRSSWSSAWWATWWWTCRTRRWAASALWPSWSRSTARLGAGTSSSAASCWWVGRTRLLWWVTDMYVGCVVVAGLRRGGCWSPTPRSCRPSDTAGCC